MTLMHCDYLGRTCWVMVAGHKKSLSHMPQRAEQAEYQPDKFMVTKETIKGFI